MPCPGYHLNQLQGPTMITQQHTVIFASLAVYGIVCMSVMHSVSDACLLLLLLLCHKMTAMGS